MIDDIDRILREVEKRKTRAEELRLPAMAWDLYREIESYTNNPEQCFLKLAVSNVEKVGRRGVSFTVADKHFEFRHEDKSGSFEGASWYDMNITLFVDEKKVFAIQVSGQERGTREYRYVRYQPAEVTAFIEAGWIEDMRELWNMLKHEQSIQNKKFEDEERRKKAESLKGDFDIT